MLIIFWRGDNFPEAMILILLFSVCEYWTLRRRNILQREGKAIICHPATAGRFLGQSITEGATAFSRLPASGGRMHLTI
jgi:hypothetical protein